MDTFAYTVNCSILLTDLPLLQRPQAAGRRVRRCRILVALRRTGAGGSRGRRVRPCCRRRGGAADRRTSRPETCRQATAGCCRTRHTRWRSATTSITAGIGERLGTKAFNALYGNRIEGVAPEKQDETATENLALAGKAADRLGAVVLVEPVSGAPAYPLKRAADAVAVIDRVGPITVSSRCDCSPTCITLR